MSADVQPLTQTAAALLAALVGFDSISRRPNLPVIRFIEDHLARLHIPYELIPSPDGHQSNLLARIGPEAEGGIVLSGHTDVVPVEGQAWESDPFTLAERSGRLYGRGTADMKSFIAACLACAPEFAKMPLTKPVYLAFSYDEEVGCLGVPYLLDHIAKRGIKPDFAVIGEPTEMKVITAHKGMASFETVVNGREWHSSQPQRGVNAVHVACDLVHFLGTLARELVERGKRDPRFDPPWSTVHVGVIGGGTARNIVPRRCSFLWEVRPLPGDGIAPLLQRFERHCDDLRREMRNVSSEASIATRAITQVAAVTLPPEAAAFRSRVMRAAQTNEDGAVSFFTEGGAFQERGIPAIVCGPGSVAQAHQPNEFVETKQLEACVEFLLRIAVNS